MNDAPAADGVLDPAMKLYVAGHRGMVGAAIVRRLRAAGFSNLVTRTHAELDLTRQAEVEAFLDTEKPDYVVLAAARVGGIHANNTRPAEFIYENLAMEANLVHGAWRAGTRRLLFLGSSCIYPREAGQPMAEDALLTGTLEPTNEPYAVAKIAGIKLCESYNRQYDTRYRSVMPTNLYGPGDNFHAEDSHVVPALMRRFHEAREQGRDTVTVWGSGRPRREFLHVDDLADACLFVMGLDDASYAAHTLPMRSHINIGSGQEVTIAELARLTAEAVGYGGRIVFDTDKPDGTPRKLLDIGCIRKLGWEPSTPLDRGLRETYTWFLENSGRLRT